MTGGNQDAAAVEGQVWACATCGDEREFVQPPCVDGHTDDGGECPEWACVDCGTAVFSGTVPAATPAVLGRAA
jgi:hypothetical protein